MTTPRQELSELLDDLMRRSALDQDPTDEDFRRVQVLRDLIERGRGDMPRRPLLAPPLDALTDADLDWLMAMGWRP